ncbi:LysR family transcriptional regulator [Roseitranquillus sediminis]|uniref:LysR family transcriptional regulator n=1 Tax=Roseitranquillus sediminis TaxID=2809051 RepID=UPI001D0CC603|nr:LysR family transcriptional regulator [Roseitranquillus sediminis]MBM9595945.1 LysR family transcriptional regulator [Roseitranquillus sediminis]
MAPVLQTRRLYYLAAIADHGSITDAARHVRVAQPALTHHMRELERELRVQLLDRSHRGTKLTDAGQLLLSHARRILDEVQRAEAALEALRTQAASADRPFRLAVIPTLASSLTPRLFAAARAELEHIRLHISEMTAREAFVLLDHGQIDAAVTIVLQPTDDTNVLAWEKIYFVCAPQLARKLTGAVSLEEIGVHPLILPSKMNYVYSEIIERFAREQGVEIAIDMQIDGLGSRKQAVIAGLGGTFLPLVAVQQEVKEGTLVARSFAPPLIRPIILATRDGLDPELVSWTDRTLRRFLRELLVEAPTSPETTQGLAPVGA